MVTTSPEFVLADMLGLDQDTRPTFVVADEVTSEETAELPSEPKIDMPLAMLSYVAGHWKPVSEARRAEIIKERRLNEEKWKEHYAKLKAGTS